mmetsp:Transcript_13667/g.17815  ORF Transcript_13667/g.17815 Transcript_13667/m.17815 type:complete len:147 (-) Transcript_13667:766-1206(-)
MNLKRLCQLRNFIHTLIFYNRDLTTFHIGVKTSLSVFQETFCDLGLGLFSFVFSVINPDHDMIPSAFDGDSSSEDSSSSITVSVAFRQDVNSSSITVSLAFLQGVETSCSEWHGAVFSGSRIIPAAISVIFALAFSISTRHLKSAS